MNRFKKLIISGVGILCAAALLVTALRDGSMNVAAAATRMYGVQEIVNKMSEETPFVMLEIIPDEAYASLGYYVNGEEPKISPELLEMLTGGENNADTRNAKVKEYFAGILDGPVSSVTYEEKIFAAEDITGWSLIDLGENAVTEERTGYYAAASEYGLEYGDYSIVEEAAEEENIVEEETTEEIVAEEETTEEETIVEEETVEEETTQEETTEEIVEEEKPVEDSITETFSLEEIPVAKMGPVSEIIYVGTGLESETTPSPEETEKVVAYEYNPGAGTHVWVDDADSEKSTVQSVTFSKIYYRVSLTNHQWFMKRVLETDNGAIKVFSVTPQQLEAALQSGSYSWNQVDLVYISESTCLNGIPAKAYSADNDISWGTVFQIYQHVVNSKLPVILDHALINTSAVNLQRLAYLLKAYTETTTMNTYGLGSEESTLTETIANRVVADVNAKAHSGEQWIAGNVYVTSGSIVNKQLTSTLYNSKSSADSGIYGVEQVVTEVEKENFYSEVNGAEYTSEYVPQDKSFNISQATLVKYILNYGQRRVEMQKESIRVLDIEPTKYSVLTEDKIRGWLGEAGNEDLIKEVIIEQMTMAEFIGKMIDLNEEYDLIYLGSCIGKTNELVPVTGSMNVSNGETVYNDASMNGLIYSSKGDYTTVLMSEFGGLLQSDYKNGSLNTGSILNPTKTYPRYSGNDITAMKAADLSEFADSGYPVVISSEFYNANEINTRRVDSASYIYGFMSGHKDRTNVMKESEIPASALARYLNMPKLDLALISAPKEYEIQIDGNKIVSVLGLNAKDGKYELSYSFETSNLAGTVGDHSAYKVQLYVDSNADGQFSAEEELHQLKIKDSSGRTVSADKIQTGVRYSLSHSLASEIQGNVYWKLKVSLATDSGLESSVRASQTGYTFIRPKEAVPIRVLQLSANDSGLNLDSSAAQTEVHTWLNALKAQELYDVSVHRETVDSYLRAYENAGMDPVEFYETYFKQYDMLILGFGNNYAEINPKFSSDTMKAAVDAIEIFVESGKAVVFSHDTTSYSNNDQNHRTWGYYLNRMIRKNAGMDRYGIVANSPADSIFSGKQGFNNILLDSETYNLSLENWFDPMKQSLVHYSNGFNINTAKISQVNKGQITTYPYDVNIDMNQTRKEKTGTDWRGNKTYSFQMVSYQTANIQETHAQYYQLDLDRDANGDGNNDLIVWYSLVDDGRQYSAYSAMPNDVRNNYYIYSLNNVTYTGMGQKNTIGTYEAKLFVNTMIAAYNLGIKNPTIDIIADEKDVDSSVDKIYRTYDEDISLDVSNEKIFFYVHDKNMINGTKILSMKYYYEVAEGTEDAIAHINENGDVVWLKKLGEKEVGNDTVSAIELSGEFINSKLALGNELKIYVGVQTQLEFASGRVETTSEVFDTISVKKRELFNLD